jgi:cytochrome c biogenesis protein CcmG, thiol:disulfide interchange protein DsbE
MDDSIPPAPEAGSGGVIGPFTRRHLVALGGTVVGVGLLLVLLSLPIAGTQQTPPPAPGASFFQISQPTVGLQVGQQAPELTGSSDGRTVGLSDLDGNPIRLADLRGHPVWIVFWATWCPPCQQETPVLRDLYTEHRAQGLSLVAISVQETTPDDVRAYARTYGLDFTIGFDATSAIFATYQGYGLPTHVFLDRNGIIRAVRLGPLGVAEAEQILAPLLGS